MPQDFSQVGLNFIVGLDGPVLLPIERKLLSELQPAGIILFARNIAPSKTVGAGNEWIQALKNLISDAKKAANREDLLVSIDHEGGRVHRLTAPITHFPHAREWKEKSFEIGSTMGKELRELSINLSFAPVLDVHSEPENPVIGVRAFSDNPKEVCTHAIAFAKGLHEQGVLSCGKHFPGHGATKTDSHLELPVLDETPKTLEERELIPFKEYIKFGGPLIMTAHVNYPQLDKENPGTLSPQIVNSLLREKLGFEGAIITDDLEMSALSNLSVEEKAIQAINAGIDILLEGQTKRGLPLEFATKMAEGLIKGMGSDKDLKKKIELSQERVKSLIEKSKTLGASAAQ